MKWKEKLIACLVERVIGGVIECGKSFCCEGPVQRLKPGRRRRRSVVFVSSGCAVVPGTTHAVAFLLVAFEDVAPRNGRATPELHVPYERATDGCDR